MSDPGPPDSKPPSESPESDDHAADASIEASPATEAGAREPDEPANPPANSTRLILGFTFRFLFTAALLSTAVYVDETVFGGVALELLTSSCATAVSTTLTFFGFEATHRGNEIVYQQHVFKIISECVGLEVLELYAAAVLAFPVSWRARLRGIAKGLPILFFINFLRMISLVLIGAQSTHALEIGHLYVWPLIVIVVAIGLWLSWAWSTNDETYPVA